MNIYNYDLKTVLCIWFQPKSIMWFILACLAFSIRNSFHVFIIIDIGLILIYLLFILFWYKLYISILKKYFRHTTSYNQSQINAKKVPIIGLFIYFILFLLIQLN